MPITAMAITGKLLFPGEWSGAGRWKTGGGGGGEGDMEELSTTGNFFGTTVAPRHNTILSLPRISKDVVSVGVGR